MDILVTDKVEKLLVGKEKQLNLLEEIVKSSKQILREKDMVAYNLRLISREKDVLDRRMRLKAQKPDEYGHLDAPPLHIKAAYESALRPLLYRLILYSAFILYIVTRLCVLAIALSSLRSMPDSAYVATWAKYLPFVD